MFLEMHMPNINMKAIVFILSKAVVSYVNNTLFCYFYFSVSKYIYRLLKLAWCKGILCFCVYFAMVLLDTCQDIKTDSYSTV